MSFAHVISFSLLLAVASFSGTASAQTDEALDEDIRNMLVEFAEELEDTARTDPDSVQETLNQFISQAPNDDAAKAGLRILAANTKSSAVQESIQNKQKELGVVIGGEDNGRGEVDDGDEERNYDDKAPATPHFAKQVEVFGLYVYATNTVSDDKLLHAAGILAQYIDNDEDGVADNPKIMKSLIDQKGAITMRKTGGEKVTGPRPRGQGLSDDQTRPNALADGIFDTAWEEVLHMITDKGWEGAYPKVFGRVPGTEIANAMDLARGGHYPDKRPEKHPDGAWYTYYDDGSCDYDCMMSEYIYWAFTSFIGAQDIPGRVEQIGKEWRPNTKAKLMKQDPTIFAILTRPEYNLATKVPNGKYKGKKLVIEPYRP